MMTNLLHGAHVANKLFSTIARLRLLLVILTMFVLSIGQMYGYTITFNGSANESTSLSTSTTAASITGNSTYVKGNLVTATKVYGATSNGVKLGTSSNAGTIKFNLSTTGQVTPTSIVVNCKLYSSSKSATLKVNGSATQNVPSSSGNLTFAITSPITYIELVSNKYIWIKSVTVNTAAGSTTYKVTYDKNGATSGSVPTDATSYNSGATVTVKSNSGNLAKTGYTFGGWNTKSDGTGTNYTAGSGTFTITANTTLYAKWNTATKYTVTLNAGPGTCAASVTEASAGAGVTLPTPTLDGCDEWSFAGWKTTSAVTTETTTEPTLISAGAYSPTSNITLYAVYQRTEGGGGGGEASLTKMVAGNTLSDGDKIVVVANETSTAMYQETINSSYVNKWDCSTLTADVVADDDKNWWTVKMTTGGFYLGDATNGYLNMSSNNLYCNADQSVWTLLDLEDGTFKLQSNGRNLSYRSDLNTNPYWRMGGTSYGTSGQTILNLYKYTSGGGGSTTYYHSTPDCGSTESTGYTITYNTNGGDVIDATSGTTLPDPLPIPTREHYTFVGWYTDENCTQAATAGATIDADITLYAKWEAILYTVTLNPNYPAGKTGVFKDKEGNTIAGNIEVPLQSGTATQALTEFYSSLTLEGYAFDAFYDKAEGGNKRVNTGVIANNITFYAHWKEKYTITWNVNGDTELISPTTFAEGDAWDMPTTDYDCSGKEFVGWTTNPIIAAQDEAPDPLYTNASQFPNATATYYAVFAENTGGGGSGGYEKLTAALDDYSGEYLIVYEDGPVAFNGGLSTLDATSNNISVTITDGVIASSATTDAAKFTFAKVDGGYSILSASGRYIGRTADSNGLNESTSTAYTNTITITEGNADVVGSGNAHLRYNKDAGQTRFRYYQSSSYTGQQAIALYKKSGSSATYTAYTTSCVPTYSITYDFAGGTGSHCSNTSVPQGDPYTICEEEPTKEGHTFLGWWDGTIRRAAGETINPTGHVTLTAQWQIKTYTVTWSNNGDTDEVPYNHGDALVVPTAASCDGVKEFVGWTEDNTFTYHATTAPTDLFKTTTATVTADATYYAVFATKGEGSANFVLGESGTFKMYANVEGTNYYAQGGVSSSKITSTTEAANASDYTLTYADGVYTIKQGTSNVGNKTNDANLNTNETTWTISEGTNGSWRVTSNVSPSRALSYSTSASAFKAYATSNIESGSYYDIEFGGTSSGYSDYTTICQQIESIEVQNPQTEFYITDDFTIGSGNVIAALSGGGTTDVTALATFSGYNMNVVGTYTVTVTYMGATATYEINVKPLANAWVLTWNVSGKTNTGLGPRYVTKGSAIGTLPTPEVPAACAGKTFMGWTESNVVPSDGVGIEYIKPTTVPTDNTTYYAVFATVNNFCTQKPIDQIASGSKVVIVAVASLTDDGGSGKAISSRATDDTYNLQGDDVAIYDQTINTPHSTCIWTIAKENGKCVFTQDGRYLNGVIDGMYSNLKYLETKDSWTLTPAASGMTMTYNMESTNASGEYIEWYNGKFAIHNEVNENGDFDMQFYVTANADGNADITDYTTGCAEYTITYYGFHGGYSTSCSSDGTIVLPVNSLHTVPNCGDVVKDHTNLGREFLNVWMTQPHGGHTFKPGDTFILTQDTTLYAQWEMETTSDVTTLPTDIEDLAGTDIYVYGGKTLNIQPGTTTINSLTLKGGLQADGSYKMPTVWVPEGATLIRNSNKIYLDLVVNAKNYYPFAVPFATKNDQYIDYLDPVLNAASTYGTHFVIKTYDGARRAIKGEDRDNNWVRVLRHQSAENPSYLQPGVGYIITALTYPDKDTATIRIPMTVPNTWFENGEQAEVGTTVRNTIAVTAHAGAAATEHQRHAGWNFVANPYLSNFTGGGIDATNGLDYIDGELIIQGSYEYSEETVPYVTIPAYNFAYYSQHKLSDVKLSPEWSFFVQVGTGGTMNFTTAGRQQAPAHLAARAAEQPIKMDVDLILSDNHNSDQTGIIISDRYSDAYEIGHDLEKLFGSAYNLSVYTLMADNTPLAFQALAIQNSMQVIPVGYRTPAQGEYTFALNEATSDIELLNEQYEQLILVDYETGALTNMLNNEYTFYSDRTQSNNRFALYAVPRQNTTTDLPNTIGNEEVRKVIYNDHFYILRDGKVFNGAGQIVK